MCFEIFKLLVEILTALGTLALAVFTAWMVVVTNKLARDSKETAAQQLAVNLWVDFSNKFDSDQIIEARKHLAENLYPSCRNLLLRSKVTGFFEDLGTVYNEDLIHKKLTRDTFGYHVTRWWDILKEEIENLRKQRGNESLFTQFGKMANDLKTKNSPTDTGEMGNFISDESHLL